MLMPIEPPIATATRNINRADLMIALAALLFLLIARPLLAQTSNSQTTGTLPAATTPMNATGMTTPGGSINPSMTAPPVQNQNSASQSTYLNPPTATPTINPGSSQSQRDANAGRFRNNVNNPQLQTLPECRVDDSNCIEQRNRMNQTNPQTAPTFNR